MGQGGTLASAFVYPGGTWYSSGGWLQQRQEGAVIGRETTGNSAHDGGLFGSLLG